MPAVNRYYSSVAIDTTLKFAITDPDGTSFEVNSTAGFPTSYPYTLAIGYDSSSEELVTIIGASGGILTVGLTVAGGASSAGRGVDGTNNQTHTAGETVKHVISARDMTEAQAHIAAEAGAHGITGSFVGTTDTQTLTNKTITGGTVNPTTLQQGGIPAVTTTGTQTLTNKTLTSPTITDPTISGTITGAVVTSANIVDGAIVNADINASAAIDKTKINGTAVTVADTGTVTNTMLAGSIAPSKVAGTAIVVNDTSYFNPVGMLTPFAGADAPPGWLLCAGQAVSRTTYAALFAITSTTYGTGDGSTTFNLPDLRGRVVAALDNMGGTDAGRLDLANTLGTVDGSQTVALTSAQSGLQAHGHGNTFSLTGAGAHRHSINTAIDIANYLTGTENWLIVANKTDNNYLVTNDGDGSHSHGITGGVSDAAAVAATAHQNMQPTILLNYIIKH